MNKRKKFNRAYKRQKRQAPQRWRGHDKDIGLAEYLAGCLQSQRVQLEGVFCKRHFVSLGEQDIHKLQAVLVVAQEEATRIHKRLKQHTSLPEHTGLEQALLLLVALLGFVDNWIQEYADD